MVGIISKRFKELRERAGLSDEDIAHEMGISRSCIWDIESHEDELTSCYSPNEVSKFCRALAARPCDLFGATEESPISSKELVERIHMECRNRGISLEQFEEAVGWYLSRSIEPPEQLLEDMGVDGLQWLCRELRIDWRRVIQ